MTAGEGGRVEGRVEGWGDTDHGKNEAAESHSQEDDVVRARIQAS